MVIKSLDSFSLLVQAPRIDLFGRKKPRDSVCLGVRVQVLHNGAPFAIVEEKSRTHTSPIAHKHSGHVHLCRFPLGAFRTYQGLLITSCSCLPSLRPPPARAWHLPTALPLISCFSCEGVRRGLSGALDRPLRAESETPGSN